MENPEGVLNLLDEFAKLKSKEIPNDLEEYLCYVASSGDPVYQWSLIKSLYRQKLINVITEFYEMCPLVEIPRCPNVDPFNYETMKNSLLKRLDSFSSAPFTIQRLSELLTTPRKQYNRVDKFMRAIEKNIWVVSTREPGPGNASQETSAGLVNGVTPRVSVSVKHPKRVKSIENRIKSGHPQLIDDDDDEEDEEGEDVDDFEQVDEETGSQTLPSNEAEESPLQCTSVKDLIEKYENGTIFSNGEDKSDFDEKINSIEETSTTVTASELEESIIKMTPVTGPLTAGSGIELELQTPHVEISGEQSNAEPMQEEEEDDDEEEATDPGAGPCSPAEDPRLDVATRVPARGQSEVVASLLSPGKEQATAESMNTLDGAKEEGPTAQVSSSVVVTSAAEDGPLTTVEVEGEPMTLDVPSSQTSGTCPPTSRPGPDWPTEPGSAEPDSNAADSH